MATFEEDEALRGPRKPQAWEVVHPRIALRARPDVKSKLAGTRKKGEELTVLATSGGWAKLSGGEYALIDGSALGFGTLIARRDAAMTLKVINPQDGSALFDYECRTTTTVLEARRAVGAYTLPNGGHLRWESIVPARGKMGTRIIDSKYNTFEDGMTMAGCDLDDGDEFGFCYLGNAREDLRMEG